MQPMLLDVRSARQQRLTLVAMTVCASLLTLVGRVVPRLLWVCAPSTMPMIVLGVLAVTAATALAVWRKHETCWDLADDMAWTVSLIAMAVIGAAGTAPVTLGMVLFGAALVAMAVRVPPMRMVLVAVLVSTLCPLVRLAVGASLASVQACIFVSVLSLFAYVTLVRATHALAHALSERGTHRDEYKSKAIVRSETIVAPQSLTLRSSRTRAALAQAEDDTGGRSSDESGWDGLIDRMRASMTTLCEPVGVTSSVVGEVQGLCPPNSRLRQNVLKIAQEAANYALRDSAPRLISVTLRRGEGGLLLEVLDDGDVGESVRSKRVLPAVRGKVAPLGGSAELRRADAGWMMRVKFPCDQLN
jgi:hypothetical protein